MNKASRLFIIAGMALALCSCAENKSATSSISTPPEWSSLTEASSITESSSESSTAYSSRAAESPSSSSEPAPSSSAVVYHTVSIYQSYYIREKGCYGDPRFDTSVKREDGQVLYKDAKEQNALFAVCGPTLHHIIGGWYEMNGFYKDEWCTDYISWAVVVKADLSIYYYCE